ncbi:MAG: hypothetical protein AAGC66_04585 [Leifsonia sp.]
MRIAASVVAALILGPAIGLCIWGLCAWIGPATLAQPIVFAVAGAVVSAIGFVAAFDVPAERVKGEWWKVVPRTRKEKLLILLAFVAFVLSVATSIALLNV